jgi:hypothetical protein
MLNGMAEGAAKLIIGQVAEQTGLSVHALRFYEREGLLAEPVRRGGSCRGAVASGQSTACSHGRGRITRERSDAKGAHDRPTW